MQQRLSDSKNSCNFGAFELSPDEHKIVDGA